MSEKKNILVVDDDVDFRFQMQTALEAAGFAVTAVAERDEAQKLLLEQKFDAAVVDLMLKYDDDGFGLCYHVRQKKPNLPIIIVTSANSQHGIHFDVTTPAEHSWICADTILEKPIRSEQIVGELNDLLDA